MRFFCRLSFYSNDSGLRACWDHKWEAGTIGRRSPRQLPSWSEIILPRPMRSTVPTVQADNKIWHVTAFCRCSEQHCMSSSTVFCHQQNPTFRRILEQLEEITKECPILKVLDSNVNFLVPPMQFASSFQVWFEKDPISSHFHGTSWRHVRLEKQHDDNSTWTFGRSTPWQGVLEQPVLNKKV